MTVANFPFWRVVPAEGFGPADGKYILPVTRPATVGSEGAAHVMGGSALGAVIDALELASEMPLLWANMQFLSPTQHAEELTISVEQCGGGRSIGQWQADISVNGRPTHRVNAAVGAREPSEHVQFAVMPDVPAPKDCAIKPPDHNGFDDNLIGQVERRVAHVDEAKGYEAAWTRSKAGFAIDAAWLGVVSDFFLGAHTSTHGGSSLDTTLRFIQASEPGWVLSVTEYGAFDRGAVHGSARHFSEDGKLLAISSQTGVLPRIPAAG
ncbi:acyl-CoA thioesterase domain-containing protein [Qipengyuania sp. DGS5-3]|uniref:acyl-CoA thioesterase domain-containing protein n=1 Tax=Qipengyuania sp. DGS5-3 TaxID=3349632 RepID=UPI0036D3E48D